ncbi:MAG TPA: acetyl-CoA carboxylase biotin carboxyl carrier protein [Kofleriaceae bacterium]|nr:acetyl-CoA carboxylase biotin carboxyl carrier protein [Kofleriaceae bacterium]
MKGGGKRERASGKGTNGPSGGQGGQVSSTGKADRRTPGDSPTVEMARQLAAIVETHALSELVVDTPQLTLTLRRGGAAPVQLGAPAPAAHAPMSPAPQGGAPRAGDSQPAAPSPSPAPAKPEPDYHVVTSPFVGTFYRSPTPDSDPYVVEGQRIDKGQVLCIVEAMKLMNEIEADTAGVVVAVMVENSQPVEYGQPLFRLAPP